jgi:glycosyltransferase involved in cell wall biosynthesis
VKVVTVGSVNPRKGIEVLVEAVNRIQTHHEETVHFFVIGPIYESQRDYGERLQREVEEENLNVHFLGYRDDIPGLLKASDIYVCSSNNEASPTAVWEAMAMKLPIVSTDVGDVRDFVTGGDPCGYVIPPRDPAKLAGAISTLVENSQERRQFSNHARETAISKLDLDICARRHASVYRDLS